MGATAALASFAATATPPAEVVATVRRHVLDQVGAALVGTTKRWNAIVRDYAVAESPPGPCTVLGSIQQVRPEWAAMANATAGHGFEIDDYALPALSHPGCVVVPTAFAVGESLDVGGHALLEAVAVGYETVLRLALATTPSLTSDRGFHVTSVHGVFGATAVAGRLRGLTADELTHAFGIAASQAGGVTEYTRSGGEVKRLHAGLAAMAGIRAVSLAAAGFTGPGTAIEGTKGLLRAFVERAQPGVLVEDLGARWHTDALALKEFCVCAGIQAPLRAVDVVRQKGVGADDIDEVVVGVDATTLAHVGAIGPHPTDMTGAQFSLQHAVATRFVLGGNNPVHYATLEAANFEHPGIARLAERVRLVVDDEAGSLFPHRLLAKLWVRTVAGAELCGRAEAYGTPHLPMSDDDVVAKFHRLADPVIGGPAARRVRAAVAALVDDGPAGDVLRSAA